MIIANFKQGDKHKPVYGLWQWGYGEVLQIVGLSLPAGTEVHFATPYTEKALVTEASIVDGNTVEVNIPNQVLVGKGDAKPQTYDIFAYIYVEDEVSGETKYTIRLNVKGRQKPEDYVYTETEVLGYKALEQRIKNLEVSNASVGQISKIAEVDENGKPTAWESVNFPQADHEASEGEDGHILNRTHYEELETGDSITFDGVIPDNVIKINDNIYLIKMSDDVYTAEQLIGKKLDVVENGEVQSLEIAEENIEDWSGNLTNRAIIMPLIQVLFEDTPMVWIFTERTYYLENIYDKGTYFICGVRTPYELSAFVYVKSLNVPYTISQVHTLAEKYIPDTIQRVSNSTLTTTDKTVIGAINEINSTKITLTDSENATLQLFENAGLISMVHEDESVLYTNENDEILLF